ncbi:RNA methyltransferase [Roseivirga misakiensis]|uniref:RNA methyltransferase n=1 Tax=Roseivirga misakiensis TaxID=1563681 RepID=A0A1E5T1B3_9BACT|nr:RNA methyltransferase [Roseivirga misakiensis]OEK05160.1 RNA methyltransferase [Roseivirga misakiensis]
MLTKRLIKYFKSLQLKKYRLQERKFLVEGAKGVTEVLESGFQVSYLLGTQEFLNTLSEKQKSRAKEVIICKPIDLSQAGTFKTNNAGIAVVDMPDDEGVSLSENELSLVLDDVRDPGNLGTIIRIADWYGIKHIYCSLETADVFNPKVINATMGSFTRVSVQYCDIKPLLSSCKMPVYGALLSGESIYKTQLSPNGVVVMGNESKGISDELLPFITNPILIPARGGAESLNVGVATAVVLDNFFRA